MACHLISTVEHVINRLSSDRSLNPYTVPSNLISAARWWQNSACSRTEPHVTSHITSPLTDRHSLQFGVLVRIRVPCINFVLPHMITLWLRLEVQQYHDSSRCKTPIQALCQICTWTHCSTHTTYYRPSYLLNLECVAGIVKILFSVKL